MPEPALRLSRLLLAALIAAILVGVGTVVWLGRGLPGEPGDAQHVTATEFSFMMGSGRPDGGRVLIDEFANGYALLSSGPVNIPAAGSRALRFEIDPMENRKPATFFWRRGETPDELLQWRMREPGAIFIELAEHPAWNGVIVEFGLLLQDDGGTPITVGSASLEPDNLALRLELMWRGWTAFEGWSQKSINFLWGGRADPQVPLPTLVIGWLVLTFALTGLGFMFRGRSRPRHMLVSGAMILIAGWMLLDLRWSANNLRHIDRALQNGSLDEHRRLSQGLDGGIYRYIQHLKNDVLQNEPSRILILGDEHAVEYYLQRAKYHLLPHSAFAARQIPAALNPSSLNYVVFFGDSPHVDAVPGWNDAWRSAMKQKETSEWGAVYEVISE